MFDLWGFLLQTFTVTGVAALILLIRRLFRDKLPPKWHFAVWGVLGIMILIPAGWNGRYTLINWMFPVELLKGLAGDYSITQVRFPLPVIWEIPDMLTEWLFTVYAAGVIFCLAKYLISYMRLRSALSKGHDAPGEIIEQVEAAAQQLNVKPCRVITVAGLASAFVSGIFNPVLAVPENREIDDKVIMHELFHLKSHDTVWSVVICMLRSLHWCNPLIVYCANCAANDMEARCDQNVLEQLEGEARREYGLTLLAMINERFAKTPGTTCVNNGGKRIRERIETIARFKKYPVGMRLVSICAVVVLMISLLAGTPATKVIKPFSSFNLVSYASARSVGCTTFAGAFDTYAKAVMTNNIYYRIMCAPEEEQAELGSPGDDTWSDEIATLPVKESGYYVYNLQQPDEDVYEALLVFELDLYDESQDEYERIYSKGKNEYVLWQPNEYEYEMEDDDGAMMIAAQMIRVEKENGRWITQPLEDFHVLKVLNKDISWDCSRLPGVIYEGRIDKFIIDVNVQTVYMVDNTLESQDDMDTFLGVDGPFDLVAKPDAVFTSGSLFYKVGITHTGSREERDQIKDIGLRMAELMPGEKRPEDTAESEQYGENLTDMWTESWDTVETSPGWGPYIEVDCGSGSGYDMPKDFDLPEYYIAKLFINKEFAGEADLYPKEGAVK
jgi:beta-lactamase regulating signal transducer with metallopeptidase domain